MRSPSPSPVAHLCPLQFYFSIATPNCALTYSSICDDPQYIQQTFLFLFSLNHNTHTPINIYI